MLSELATAEVTEVIDQPTLETKLNDYRQKTIDSCDEDITSAQTSFDDSLAAAETEISTFVEDWKTSEQSKNQ